MRLLLVEESEEIARPILEAMRCCGYETDWPNSESEVEAAVLEGGHGLMLLALDFMRLDVLELIRRYRLQDGRAAVVALIDRDGPFAPLSALDSGADDYLMKLFDIADLNARIRVLLTGYCQRRELDSDGRLWLDADRCMVHKNGVPIALKPVEFRLIKAFVNEPGRVFTRDELSLRICGRARNISIGAINVHIHALRRKLGAEQIVTIRGRGYRFNSVFLEKLA